MKRLIFQDPPEDMDETWTHGALLGGMCGYSEEQIADSYFVTANMLVKGVLERKELAADEMINPTLFLYRHGIELFLKCIVQPDIRDHNLGKLLERFCRYIRKKYGEEIPPWFTKPISEFIEHDPKSLVFRFESADFACSGEFWIDLRALRESMARLRYAFRRVLVAEATGTILPRGAIGQIVPGPRPVINHEYL